MRSRWTCVPLFLLLGGAAYAQPAFQVRDVEQHVSQAYPFRGEFVEMAGVNYFPLSDGIHGRELWRSDGTEAGTYRVRDICPGACASNPRDLTVLNGRLYFQARDAFHGPELWTSDGTQAGTYMLFDSSPGPYEPGISPLTALNGSLIFYAYTPNQGTELWKSDGTPGGTGLLKEIRPGTQGRAGRFLATAGTTLFFVADDGTHGAELWKTDGTTEGTVLVKDIRPGGGGSLFMGYTNPAIEMNPVIAGGKLFFNADHASFGAEVWMSDGTEAGTVLVKDVYPGPFPSNPISFTEWNGDVYFVAMDTEHGRELWKTNGTTQGTVLVKDIGPGPLSASPFDLTVAAGQLFFISRQNAAGHELWKSDGTEEGTARIPGTLFPSQLRAAGDRLAFFMSFVDVDNVSRSGFWATDGTEAGTERLATLQPGAPLVAEAITDPLLGGPLAGDWFFGAFENPQGWSVWKSDGTLAGTQRVRFVHTQASTLEVNDQGVLSGGSRAFLGFDEGLLFQAKGLSLSLWKTDGTEDGTLAVREDFGPLPDQTPIREFTLFDEQAFFIAGGRLWSSDGTEEGTVKVSDEVYPTSNLAAVGDTLFFGGFSTSTFNELLWKTDGTSAGTSPVFGSGFEELWYPKDLTPFQGLLFAAASPGLWKSDGTSDGTAPLHSHGFGSVSDLTLAGNRLFFWSAASGAYRLWTSDGTSPGTRIVQSSGPNYPAFQPEDERDHPLAWAAGRLFFLASGATYGTELWTTDGTAAGTALVRDIRPGSLSSGIHWLTAAGNHVFFVADDGVHGRELWVSDGTAAGTRLVRDVVAGAGTSHPQGLTYLRHAILFSAHDGVHGLELWTSDGTEAGTTMVQDLAPGVDSSSPQLPTLSGKRIYIGATDATTGFEIWALPRTAIGSAFRDVPRHHWSWSFVETLAEGGLTSGCGNGDFCPTRPVTRAEMAIFLERAFQGSGFTPPPATGTLFQDIPADHWAAAWIEQLASDGITGGCSVTPPLYCPNDQVTRAQMAIFLLLAKHGPGYAPPPATGTRFLDIPSSHWAGAWIEQLAAEGITSGCGANLYCPDTPLTREQMAVFLSLVFNLGID